MSDLWNTRRSLYDLAGDLADSLDDGDGDSSTPVSSIQIASNSGGSPAPPRPNPANVNAFFDSQYDRISQLADEMNLPPNLMLGWAAHESGWGRKNNLFGISTGSGKAINYPSFDDGIDAFRNSQWFLRLQNKDNVDDFVNELMDTTGGKKRYNSEDTHYADKIKNAIATVNRRLPIWQSTR